MRLLKAACPGGHYTRKVRLAFSGEYNDDQTVLIIKIKTILSVFQRLQTFKKFNGAHQTHSSGKERRQVLLSAQRAYLYRAMAINTVIVLYLKFLLLATAGLFYELYHLLNIDVLYWIYSALKVVAVLFDQWPGQNLALFLLWLLLSLFSYWKHRRHMAVDSQ